METRELAPKTYKRLLRAFTPAVAKTSVDKWIDIMDKTTAQATRSFLLMEGFTSMMVVRSPRPSDCPSSKSSTPSLANR